MRDDRSYKEVTHPRNVIKGLTIRSMQSWVSSAFICNEDSILHRAEVIQRL